MVPIMSFPTFSPEKNSCLAVSAGFTSRISQIADAIDIPTSITAPSEDISTPANSTSATFNSVLEEIRTINSASSVLYPEI